MFKPKRQLPPGTDKTKALVAEAQQLAFRAAQLGARADRMWDRGRYDEADKLQEEANDLRDQEHRVEERVREMQAHPGLPTPKSPLSIE